METFNKGTPVLFHDLQAITIQGNRYNARLYLTKGLSYSLVFFFSHIKILYPPTGIPKVVTL